MSSLDNHPIQYAFVGHIFITNTEGKNDDEVRREARVTGLPVERFQRCPTCEQWSPCDVRIAATRC